MSEPIAMPHASTMESMGRCVFCGLPANDPGPCEKRPRPGASAAQGHDEVFFAEMEADLAHRLRWRKRICRVLTLGHHLFGKPWRVDVGPVGFTESDETLLAWHRQCRVCYEVVNAE